MPTPPTVVQGTVSAFALNERGLFVKFRAGPNRTLVLRVESRRLDFKAQLQMLQYVLSFNEEQAVRALNGLQAQPAKQVWVQLPDGNPPNWVARSQAGNPPVVSPRAIAMSEGNVNPFDRSLAAF